MLSGSHDAHCTLPCRSSSQCATLIAPGRLNFYHPGAKETSLAPCISPPPAPVMHDLPSAIACCRTYSCRAVAGPVTGRAVLRAVPLRSCGFAASSTRYWCTVRSPNMQRVLKASSRLAHFQAIVPGAYQTRAFAAAVGEVAVADESPFLRYATPIPQPYSYANLLGSIPATQVSLTECMIVECTWDSPAT